MRSPWWQKANELPEVPSTPCVLWTGALDRRGYGTFDNQYAHRMAYVAERGPIPEGLVIDHLCRNHACVNVDHLEAVTAEENKRRGQSVPAVHARKMHCKVGHPYDEANTYLRPDNGNRGCRACRAAAMKKFYERENGARR
jgi:hypothetical protein